MGLSMSRCPNCARIPILQSPSNEGLLVASPARIYNRRYKEIGLIGKGGFGKVFLVKSILNDQLFALKKLSKRFLLNNQQDGNLKSILTERTILISVKSPFIVNLFHCFQDNSSLYFVLEFCEGGSLERYLERTIVFSESSSRFLLSEILMALIILHEDYNVIYRDLKPENILICADGHIKLADFGLSVIGKTHSISECGTPEFVAPEVLDGIPHTRTVDLWSLGCLAYLFMFGRYPFEHRRQSQLFEKIQKGKFTFPSFPIVSSEAKHFIRSLLQVNPGKRLGADKTRSLTSHPFFDGVDWNAVKERKNESPIPVQSISLKSIEDRFSVSVSQRISRFSFEIDESKIKANSV